MSATLQKRAVGAFTSAASGPPKELNAESVTAIATGFLKRIGHKGGLKPKRVSLEEDVYTVEIEMKKLSAIVQVDAKTHEIKAYEIQSKGEEASSFAISPKTLAIVFGVSVGAYVAMHFVFKMLAL